MKLYKHLLYTILLFTCPVFGQEPAADGFKLVKKENNISLFERWIPHNGKQIRELKATFQIRSADGDKLESLLKNESLGLQWNHNASKYIVPPGNDPDDWLTYIEYDLPWPLEDISCLLQYHRAKMPAGTTLISFAATQNSAFPITDKTSRMTGTYGKWLAQQQGSILNVTYVIATDRSKSIPRWISDPLVYSNLFKTMGDFKKLIEKK